MTQPQPYIRQAAFVGTSPYRDASVGVNLDAEFNAIKITLDQLLRNLKVIQRDDTALANGSVGTDQLAPDLAAYLLHIDPALPGFGAVLKSDFFAAITALAAGGMGGFEQYILASPDDPLTNAFLNQVFVSSGDVLFNGVLSYFEASPAAARPGLGLSSSQALTLLASLFSAVGG